MRNGDADWEFFSALRGDVRSEGGTRKGDADCEPFFDSALLGDGAVGDEPGWLAFDEPGVIGLRGELSTEANLGDFAARLPLDDVSHVLFALISNSMFFSLGCTLKD